MQPPLGTFTLRAAAAGFVAGGDGNRHRAFSFDAEGGAPGPDSPALTLLFGVRHESHLLYRDEFEQMAREFPHFRFWPTLTQPGPEWTGRTGRVQTHLAEAIGERTRHRHLSLRLAAHGGRCAADTEGHGIRSQANPLREIRLMGRTISLALAVVLGLRGGSRDHAEGDARAAQGQRLSDHRLGVHDGVAAAAIRAADRDLRESVERIFQAAKEEAVDASRRMASHHALEVHARSARLAQFHLFVNQAGVGKGRERHAGELGRGGAGSHAPAQRFGK